MTSRSRLPRSSDFLLCALCALLFLAGSADGGQLSQEGRTPPQEKPTLSQDKAGARAASAVPEDLEKLLADGLRALDEGRYSEGLPLLARGHELCPDDGRFTFALGKCYFASGEEFLANPDYGGDPGAAFYDAEAFFRKTLELDPAHAEAGAALAEALYMNGNMQEAVTVIEEHLVRCPDDGSARIVAGKVLVGDFSARGEAARASLDAAQRHLEVAIEKDARAAEAYLLLGDRHLYAGEAESALTVYQAGIAACPSHMDLHGRLVSCFKGSEHLSGEDATGFYEALLARKGNEPAAKSTLLWYLGVWHDAIAGAAYTAKDFAAAARAYRTSARCYERCAAAHEPFTADARQQEALEWANAGWAHLYAEEYEQAEARFGRALALAPEFENAVLGLDTLGTAILSRQGLAKGRDFFRRCALTNPRRAKWWNNYALFCRETGRSESAYRAYVKAAFLAPDDTRYVNDVGMMLMYYLKRDLDEAEARFRKAWKIGEERCANPFISDEDRAWHFEAYCDAMLNLGRLLLLAGRTAEAEPIIRSLGEKALERPDVKQLLGALELAKEGKPFEFPE